MYMQPPDISIQKQMALSKDAGSALNWGMVNIGRGWVP